MLRFASNEIELSLVYSSNFKKQGGEIKCCPENDKGTKRME